MQCTLRIVVGARRRVYETLPTRRDREGRLLQVGERAQRDALSRNPTTLVTLYDATQARAALAAPQAKRALSEGPDPGPRALSACIDTCLAT